MGMVPPPAGWSVNNERGRRVFAAWLKERERTALIQVVTLVVGCAGLIAMLAMYSWAIAVQAGVNP